MSKGRPGIVCLSLGYWRISLLIASREANRNVARPVEVMCQVSQPALPMRSVYLPYLSILHSVDGRIVTKTISLGTLRWRDPSRQGKERSLTTIFLLFFTPTESLQEASQGEEGKEKKEERVCKSFVSAFCKSVPKYTCLSGGPESLITSITCILLVADGGFRTDTKYKGLIWELQPIRGGTPPKVSA